MTTGRKILLAVVSVIALALIAAAVYMGISMHTDTVYTEILESGEKYMAAGDYDNAVITYQQAIETNEEDEEGYLGLANAYIAREEFEMAEATLQTGIEKTHSARLSLLYDNLLISRNSRENNKRNENLILAVNRNYLTTFGGNTYADYSRQYQVEEAEGSSVIKVRFKGFPAVFTYSNNEVQPNAVSSSKVSDYSIPTSIVLDDIMTLFGGGERASYEELSELELHDLRKESDHVHGAVVRFNQDQCTVTIVCDADGNISSDSWNEIVPDAAVSSGEGQGQVVLSGIVTDATTGETVEGVSIVLREGTREYGEAVASAVTDGSGNYSVNVDSGQYRAEISKSGYTTIFKDIFIGSASTAAYQDFTISPELASGEVRIVLEWNSTPTDLDAYLVGHTDAGGSVSVFWSQPDGGDVAQLDVDDRDGHGPETITITNLQGYYTYHVVDYTMSGTMAEMGATVTIYAGDAAPVTVTLDTSSGVKNIWDVCSIDHGTVTILDRSGD